MNKNQLINALADRAKDGDLDAYVARFLSALDETHDIEQALDVADEATAKSVQESDEGKNGRWITIGAKKADGKSVGGSPVYVQGGRITKGAPSLHGKKIDALKEPGEGQSVKAANKTQAEYDRAKYAKEARSMGIRSQDLHQLAGEILAHGNANSEDTKRMLAEIRRVYPHFGTIAARHAKGNFDSTMVPGIDVAAKEFSASGDYAHLWPHRADDLEKTEHLFHLFTHGHSQMSEKEAYEQAIDFLRKRNDEEVPF